MSQRVKIDRVLAFETDANRQQNVEGDFDPERIMREYNFTELALDGTNLYTKYLDTTSTIASGSGGALLTTATTDTKTCSISCGGIWWYPAKKCVMEAKFSIDVVTNVAINVGFNDAVSEGSGVLPFLITGSTVADACLNGVAFCFDDLQTTDYWYIVNTKAGTEAGTILASTYAPAAGISAILRVAIDTAGNARYYYNGVEVGYKALATATATPLVPYVGIRNNSGTAHVLTLRYVRCWQDS